MDSLWLTVGTIMRDPKWMGTSPSQFFWSEDGQWVYFSWRQEGDEEDSLYVVSAATHRAEERELGDGDVPSRGSWLCRADKLDGRIEENTEIV